MKDSLAATLENIFNLVFLVGPLLLINESVFLFIHVLQKLLYAVFLLPLYFISDLFSIFLIGSYQNLIRDGPFSILV